jgi:predicted acyltransferase
MDDFVIWSVPLVFFLCATAVQALRKHWHNALAAALAAALTLAIMACAGQAHINAMLRGRLQHAEAKIEELEQQLNNHQEEPSNT